MRAPGTTGPTEGSRGTTRPARPAPPPSNRRGRRVWHPTHQEKAPGGRHTTRSGASSRWRVGKLRFGTAIVRRPVPRLSPRPASPPRGHPGLHRGIGCVQRPRSRRGLRRTRHRARLGLRLRPPRRFGLGPAPLRGRPLREARLGLPPAFGSGSLRLRPLSLADSHVNTFGRKPQVPILAEPGEIGRKTSEIGQKPRKSALWGAATARIGRRNTPVGRIPLPRWTGQLPRWTGAAPPLDRATPPLARGAAPPSDRLGGR